MFSEPASDGYAQIDFNEPDDFYNRPAPDPLYAWIIGSVLCAVTAIYWYHERWCPVMASIHSTQSSQSSNKSRTTQSLHLRVFIGSVADNDDPIFTILRVSSQSMFLLACFQINYLLTLVVMSAYYTLISCTDSLRVLVSLQEADGLHDLMAVSKHDRLFLPSTLKLMTPKDDDSAIDGAVAGTGGVACAAKGAGAGAASELELEPQNVYEDLSRNMVVVWLIFITQCVLICFVLVDAFGLEVHMTFDKTNKVPILATLGSYFVYILGIFMQCVYLLGPKNNFGASEQNPHFWLQILLSVKRNGCQCQWESSVDGLDRTRVLRPGDWNVWMRFVMSYMVNGVGFHVLVHALPIQVAGQSSLTGIVTRAVGMMYLVDLDDTCGTVLKLLEYSSRTEMATAVTKAKLAPKPCPFGDDPLTSDSRKHEDTTTNKYDLMMQNRPLTTTDDAITLLKQQPDVVVQGETSSCSSQDGEEKQHQHSDDDEQPTAASMPTAPELIEQALEQAQLLHEKFRCDLAALLSSTAPEVMTTFKEVAINTTTNTVAIDVEKDK